MKNAATIVLLLLTGIAECQQAFLSASTSLVSKSPAAGLKREEGLDPVKDGELLSTEDDVDWATGRLEEKIGIGQDVERLGSDGDSIGGDGDDNDEEKPRLRYMNRALKKKIIEKAKEEVRIKNGDTSQFEVMCGFTNDQLDCIKSSTLVKMIEDVKKKCFKVVYEYE